MKRSFNQYTDAELLTLDNETINDAIRIESIERGIKPPITLSEALRTSEWRGYQLPAEEAAVYQLNTRDDSYSSFQHSGIAYLSEDRAKAAMEGIVVIDENRYGKGGPIIKV